MKNFFAILFITALVLLLSISIPTYAVSSNEVNLSELTESECISFLKERGVTIPGNSENEMLWGAFAKEIITRVEENPNVIFAFGYTELLEFADDIKAAVNEYNGRTRSIHVINLQLVSSLLYSTKCGEWDDTFSTYNCYGYAIETYEKKNPGDMRGLSFDMTADIEDIADIVAADLEWLGYTVLTVSQDRPSVNVDAHTRLICVRKDLDIVAQVEGETVSFIQDYHFMKLGEDGNWYHKPGKTNPLKYNLIPSNSEVWVHEICYMGDYYRDAEWTYESTIYYIAYTTPHDWEYEYSNSERHEMTCTICGDTDEENCNLSYSCVFKLYHQGTCTDCGYSTSNTLCEDTYTYVSNGNGSHTATCSVCEGSFTRQCNKECTWYSGSQHRAECTDCGIVTYESCNSGVVYTGNGTTHTHALGCDECGHTTGTATACTFSAHFAYTENGVNYHRYVCDGCGYTKAGVVQCVYKNSDNCFLCGTSRDAGMVASTQEPSTAE